MGTNRKSRNILNPRGMSLCEDFDLSGGNETDWTDTMSDSDTNAELDYMRGMSLSLSYKDRRQTPTPPGFSDWTAYELNRKYDNDSGWIKSDNCSFILDRETKTIYKAFPGVLMRPMTFIMGTPEDIDFNGMMRGSKTWNKYFGKTHVTLKDRYNFISDHVLTLPQQLNMAKEKIQSALPDIDIDCEDEGDFEFTLADNINTIVSVQTDKTNTRSPWIGYTEVFAPAVNKWFGFFITDPDPYEPAGHSLLSNIGVFGTSRLTDMFDRIPVEYGMERDVTGRYKFFWWIKGLADYLLDS